MTSPAPFWWAVGQLGSKSMTGADQHKGYYRDIGSQYNNAVFAMASSLPLGSAKDDWRAVKMPTAIQLIQDGIDASVIPETDGAARSRADYGPDVCRTYAR